MRNKEAVLEDGETACVTVTEPEFDDWGNFGDDDIMQQKSAIHAEEAKKVPFLGDKASSNTIISFKFLSIASHYTVLISALFY